MWLSLSREDGILIIILYMDIPPSEVETVRKNSRKDTIVIWNWMAIRDIMTRRTSNIALDGNSYVSTLSMLSRKWDHMSIGRRCCGEYSIAAVCLLSKISLTRNILAIMKGADSCVSRRSPMLEWGRYRKPISKTKGRSKWTIKVYNMCAGNASTISYSKVSEEHVVWEVKECCKGNLPYCAGIGMCRL